MICFDGRYLLVFCILFAGGVFIVLRLNGAEARREARRLREALSRLRVPRAARWEALRLALWLGSGVLGALGSALALFAAIWLPLGKPGLSLISAGSALLCAGLSRILYVSSRKRDVTS